MQQPKIHQGANNAENLCTILLTLAIAVFTFGTANAYPSYDCSCSSCHSRPDECAPVIVNTAPVADAGTDVTVFVGETVNLDGSGSVDMDGDTLTYQWMLIQVPLRSNATLSDPTAVQPTFVMDDSGDYVARLVVSDENLASDTAKVPISTQNSAPVADAGRDQSAEAGDTVFLAGVNSGDVDGDTLSYSWSLNTKPGTARQRCPMPQRRTPALRRVQLGSTWCSSSSAKAI